MSNIASGNTIAEVANLIGDAARANMLSALMGGQALTAGELARHAGVTPQTTSGHLGKLAEAELIAVEKQGRHRYYRLASPDVAHAIHALMAVAASGPKRYHPIGPRDEALRLARTCYDHMAGRLAVALADALTGMGHVVLADGAGLVTDEGRRFFCDFGIKLDGETSSKRPLCRTCLDWSERRPHLAGRLGAALLDRSVALGWISRTAESRALRITRAGEAGFSSTFCLPPDWRAPLFSQKY
ncbi:ArsR/SmtB family transcription factor [Shinella oryzae]|uniref:Helix-turn-helix transcriptional regulator n=1 Tax=Shinella oryzae TaxID=2871820 RepID=A0ABY9KAE8_9HYPH|nr:helix-turn-helix transcriptional regulator [Shinella oryzae]WLS04649.1 helix-turn-helix transcriptional regulator [Shinella oryzae]